MLADTKIRKETRILIIYNLGGRLRIQPDLLHSFSDWFDMERFSHHIIAAASLLPQITYPVSIAPERFDFADHQPRARVTQIAVAMATTPRRDGLLIVDVKLGESHTADDIADFLYATWRWRSTMRIDGIAILDWLAAHIGHVTTDANEPPVFGQNVHQCVFAGGRFARRILRRNRDATRVSPDVIAIVFRGTLTGNRGSNLDVRRPPALNNSGETMVAHGRGVSLVVGWAEPVENAFGIAAAGLVNAAGVVRRIRFQSLEALEINETSAATTVAEIRTLIANLSDRLDQLRLDLSFGIEVYADTTLIPELLIESYHSSLRHVASLSESLTNTSRIVDRVAAVIESRHAMLEASVQSYIEGREKVFAVAIAIGSLLALPPTLLLGYFGTNSTNVDPRMSIFDLRHYGIVYVAVWIPFIALVAGAVVMRRRIHPHRPEWRHE